MPFDLRSAGSYGGAAPPYSDVAASMKWREIAFIRLHQQPFWLETASGLAGVLWALQQFLLVEPTGAALHDTLLASAAAPLVSPVACYMIVAGLFQLACSWLADFSWRWGAGLGMLAPWTLLFNVAVRHHPGGTATLLYFIMGCACMLVVLKHATYVSLYRRE